MTLVLNEKNVAVLCDGDGDDVLVYRFDQDGEIHWLDLIKSGCLELVSKGQAFSKFRELAKDPDPEIQGEIDLRIEQMNEYEGQWIVGTNGDYLLILACVLN